MPELEKKGTGGLTALGVVSLVLGAIWFAGAVWGLLTPATVAALAKQSGAPLLLTGFAAAAVYIDAAINLPLALLLFVAGVGLLGLRKWGARLATWFAVLRILWSVVALVLAFVGPFANRAKLESVPTFVPVVATLIVAAFVCSIVYPVILLCLLGRESYRSNLR